MLIPDDILSQLRKRVWGICGDYWRDGHLFVVVKRVCPILEDATVHWYEEQPPMTTAYRTVTVERIFEIGAGQDIDEIAQWMNKALDDDRYRKGT